MGGNNWETNTMTIWIKEHMNSSGQTLKVIVDTSKEDNIGAIYYVSCVLRPCEEKVVYKAICCNEIRFLMDQPAGPKGELRHLYSPASHSSRWNIR